MVPTMPPRRLTPAEVEWYDERAAIRQYDGLQTRSVAEREALADVLRARDTEAPTRPAAAAGPRRLAVPGEEED